MIHKRVLTLLILLAAMVLAGCNSSDDFDSDTDTQNPALATGLKTLVSDGEERSYYLLMPGDTSMEVSASAADDPKPPRPQGGRS